ncbi:penicillin-binding transpeptidase domain-containing protein [Dorea formicigenerans]|jgi:bla regulator protein BlaR1|uniref:Serine hydrolase n=1 Tax=Dorea formicigenerans TaxID=39486 RepID=A0A3E4PT92_9FIRM|nr:penicillin-binding transpeptidase domain-containing protein [Dorea formicigenerans]MDK0837705.1 penicillin-binding transpeptidase domain-containing protein [Clostridium perfringens]RGK83284.1 serine hydrolase [Dorea formicigenerans]
MSRLFKITCILVICFLMLLGCSSREEKVELIETNQLEQSKTDDKTEEKVRESNEEETLDLSANFNGITGCAVLYSPSENKYSLYNKDMAEQEVSPYSTFKIISTLIGLHNDIIKDETSTMNYDGTQYPNSEWNENLTLQKAFQTSCIWYFHQIINSAGEQEVKKELSELEYGNCDVSAWEGSNINPYKELNGFWLGSSLKISPYEQVGVLSKIWLCFNKLLKFD